MNNRLKLVFVLLLGLIGGSVPALANEAGLYDPAPPPGSSYLRLINANAKGAISLSLDGSAFVSAPEASASDYIVVPQGAKSAGFGGKDLTVTLGAGKFYSIVVSAGQGRLVEDPILKSRAKALLRMYNLTAKTALSLKTADGKVAIIDNVAAAAASDREVSGATLKLAVFDGAAKLAETPEVAIKRGFVYSVMAIGSGDSIKAVWVKSATRQK